MIYVKIEMKLKSEEEIADAISTLLMLLAQDLDNPKGYRIMGDEGQVAEINFADDSKPEVEQQTPTDFTN